ncbi:sulfotransferase domain-containing protein [Serinicoccus chungangensis]|uniref:sulfotransferase domain-containing protein n=1 Tax=Serinicoccus chungangensis TaxID=767452 RepID=UPI0013797A49|nr:sulfotransferase domain-containing protein [Serinicoccus chungangensis]
MLRRVALLWGVATVRWRMKPSFLVVGAQRSGTTSLFRLLETHPQVVRPTLDKGIGYFDLNYSRPWSWYISHFPIRPLAALMRGTKRVVTFESSGYYMFHPLAHERIADDLPGVKVVMMLRNPVDRAHSAHRHEQRRGFEAEDFETAVSLETTRLAGEVERIKDDPYYVSFAHQHHAYVGRGEYAQQVARLIDSCGRENVYVIDADAFFDNPAAEFSQLCRWLGLDEPAQVKADAWNAAPRAPLRQDLRRRLEVHFEPHDVRLEHILGRTVSWRSGQMPVNQKIDDPP